MPFEEKWSNCAKELDLFKKCKFLRSDGKIIELTTEHDV